MMLPGPMSDSYDPEFGTGANARDVNAAIQDVRDRITVQLGPELKNIVAVAQGKAGAARMMSLREKDLRVIRFCLDRAMEST